MTLLNTIANPLLLTLFILTALKNPKAVSTEQITKRNFRNSKSSNTYSLNHCANGAKNQPSITKINACLIS